MTNMITLAIADDHKMMRQCMVDALNSFDGIKVTLEACNGKDLLYKLKHTTTLPDICLMDISMPEIDGYEATSLMAKEYPKVKVLAVTMLSDDFNIIRILQHGACGYICKDKSIEELHAAILTLQREGFYSSIAITSALKVMMRSKAEGTKSYVLNDKEILFLSMCCTKLRYAQIARKLCISYKSIGTLQNDIYRKLNISTRLELAIFAMRVGITPYSEVKEIPPSFPSYQGTRR